MKEKVTSYKNRIVALILTFVIFGNFVFDMTADRKICLGEEVLLHSTTSFSSDNTSAEADAGKEYQLGKDAALAAEQKTVTLVSDTPDSEGSLSITQPISITDGFSTVGKFSMGEGETLFTGELQFLLIGIGNMAVNRLKLAIYRKSDTELGVSLEKETETESETDTTSGSTETEEAGSMADEEEDTQNDPQTTSKQEQTFQDFTTKGKTDLYCWIDYHTKTDTSKEQFQLFLSHTSERPETPQATFEDTGLIEQVGSDFNFVIAAKNPETAGQKVDISRLFFDDSCHTDGIDISAYESNDEENRIQAYSTETEIAKLTYTLTIHYQKEDQTKIAEDYSQTYEEGKAYVVVSPQVEGYTAGQTIVRGTMAGENTELTVTYYQKILYTDLPGPPDADILSQSDPQDVWAKTGESDTEEIYENTSRPLAVNIKRWDESSLEGTKVLGYQMLYVGPTGYEINAVYQTFFDQELQVENATALQVQQYLTGKNNEEMVKLIGRILTYTKENNIASVTTATGTNGRASSLSEEELAEKLKGVDTNDYDAVAAALDLGDTPKIVLDCSRRYEQTRGYYGGYGYYLLYAEDSAGEEYVMAELNSANPESSVYLKQNKLSLIKEVGKPDYSLHEDVVFTISATLPNLEGITELSQYQYFVTDLYDPSLTPQFDTMTVQAVAADNTAVALTLNDDYTITEGENTWKLDCNFSQGTHLKDNQQKNKTLRICYKAKLNENAILAGYGNTNSAKLTYTENPANASSAVSETELSTVKCFTYQIELHKIGSDNSNLKDAAFEVRDANGEQMFFTQGSMGTYFPTEKTADKAKSVVTTDEEGLVNIFGLGSGEFTFKEVTAPTGYLRIPEFTINITPTYDENLQTLRTLESNTPDNAYLQSVEVKKDSGKIAAIVIDPAESGALPLTGGRGRLLIYVSGIGLITAGIATAVKRKRSSKKKKKGE
ncbi:MAG: SpaA isopeptide-forming pilin-related protein [Lachnospiraceae bacterium]